MKSYYKYRAIVVYHHKYDARILAYHPNDGWQQLAQSNAVSVLQRQYKELEVISLVEFNRLKSSIESQFSE